MIYTVERSFSDAARQDAWNARRETCLAHRVSLPGLNTARWFRAMDGGAVHAPVTKRYS